MHLLCQVMLDVGNCSDVVCHFMFQPADKCCISVLWFPLRNFRQYCQLVALRADRVPQSIFCIHSRFQYSHRDNFSLLLWCFCCFLQRLLVPPPQLMALRPAMTLMRLGYIPTELRTTRHNVIPPPKSFAKATTPRRHGTNGTKKQYETQASTFRIESNIRGH